MIKSILIIQNRIYLYSSGGYEIQLYYICQGLIKKRWTVNYLAEHDSENRFYDQNIYIHLIQPKYFFSFINKKAFKLTSPNAYSIIYQRSRNNFSCGLIGLRLARKSKAKFVFGLGCIDDLYSYFLTKSLWKNKKINFLKKILATPDTLIKDFLFPYNIKKADLIISQNREQQELCKKRYGQDSVIVRSIHPPVDKVIVKNNPPVVCWIANARPVKQPELFLELIEGLQDLVQIQKIRFIMVLGRNIQMYKNTALMQRLKKYSSVEVLGQLTIDEANGVMEKSSILVNTSIYEGFSNTFIQAWLRETPVVSLNSDPDDIIKDYQIGFHSKTMDQLKNDVRYLIENPDVRTSMGKKARAYAEEHHHPDKIAKQLDELFTRFLQNQQ